MLLYGFVMSGAQLVMKFIEAIGRRNEIEYYLKLFQNIKKEAFALLVIQPSVLRMTQGVVATDLKFLFDLGLVPVVVIAKGRSEDHARLAHRLEQKLKECDVQTALINDPLSVGYQPLLEAVAQHQVPLLIQPEPSVNWITDVLKTLKSQKLIFVRTAGGLRKNQRVLPVINLSKGYDELIADKDVPASDKSILEAVEALITRHAAHKVVAAVTSPFDLLKELFTTKGAGTLLRKGAQIIDTTEWSPALVERVRTILQMSFEAAVDEHFFQRPIERIFLEEEGQGLAIVQQTPHEGCVYLTKFAVSPQAQGEGLGKDLWDALIERYPRVFWRARRNHPIHSWYLGQAHGWVAQDDWNVYWRNLPVSELENVVNWVLSQPIDIHRENA